MNPGYVLQTLYVRRRAWWFSTWNFLNFRKVLEKFLKKIIKLFDRPTDELRKEKDVILNVNCILIFAESAWKFLRKKLKKTAWIVLEKHSTKSVWTIVMCWFTVELCKEKYVILNVNFLVIFAWKPLWIKKIIICLNTAWKSLHYLCINHCFWSGVQTSYVRRRTWWQNLGNLPTTYRRNWAV